MFTKLTALLTVSSLVIGLAGAAYASEIFFSTLTVDSRPWWQTMQRASGPRPVALSPDGKVTSVRFWVTLLWQASQLTGVPTGHGPDATWPCPGEGGGSFRFEVGAPSGGEAFGFASTPTKSWYPTPLWHLAQFWGTTAGLSLFQCAK